MIMTQYGALPFWQDLKSNKISLKKQKNNWVEELDEVNTDNVEPLVSVNSESLTLRQDEVTAGHICEEILANAPVKEYGYFVVPKVVE